MKREKIMVRSAIAAVLLVAGASLAFAQSDPVAHRIDLMKQVGDATKITSAMMKGEVAFDLAKVQETLAVYQRVASEIGPLFPESAKTGKDSTAAPAIWESRADFDAKLARWHKDSAEAAAAIKDEATFKTSFRTVLANCKSCHDDFRIKK